MMLSACSSQNELQGEKKHLSDQEAGSEKRGKSGLANVEGSKDKELKEKAVVLSSADLERIKPDESGKIMIVMFHNFVSSFTPTKYDKGEYTTTFDDFKKLLITLYEKNYRLINMNDYLDKNVDVAAGCIPMIFTFDDGSTGQFNLIKEGDKFVANKQSAVGIMEEFNKNHPDFGLKGTFYVNLGLKTFEGEGSLEQRLKYLIDKGFEIGNHTLTHVNLDKVTSSDKVIKELGGNQKKMGEVVSGYKMKTLALPYGGLPAKGIEQYVVRGEYDGIQYENLALLEVGWDPAPSPVNNAFKPTSLHRVRASGINPVETDLGWWLKNLAKSEQYVSDGNKDTITIPKAQLKSIREQTLGNKKLVTY